MYTYEEVERHLNYIVSDTKQALAALEEAIVNERDNNGLPVYLTKYRVKSIDSLYLKTKRKNKSLDEITDMGGFRVLCLFEQDIFKVNDFLCKLLSEQGYFLLEFIVFNWKNEKDKELLSLSPAQRFRNEFITEQPKKTSGYKSIHYVISKTIGEKKCNIEIQLRTLLQDVWGELEHALAYKQGSIHPHIKKSFTLLSRDLESKDMLLTHLKEIYQNEKTIERFGLRNAGPYRVFEYEDEYIPDLFKSEPAQEPYQKYTSFVQDEALRKKQEPSEWRESALGLYDTVRESINAREASEVKMKYWLGMEKSFIEFASSQIDDALYLYKGIGAECPLRYVPFFRQGEILFVQGKIEAALVSFDTAERILNDNKHNMANEYRLKVKLANIYWLLGPEYNPLAIEKINEAKVILFQNREDFGDSDERSLINNLCWYELEQYLITEAEEDFQTVERTFEQLEDLINESSDISSNTLDTAAWFLYQKYLKTDDLKCLSRAKDYCQTSWDKKNLATNAILSVNIHRNHIHTIMGA